MADYYLDHAGYASQLGATPAWGVPQDGDGSAAALATASAVAAIQFTAVPTSGSVVVCGVTFASPSGVLSAASVDAAANAMASLINGSTTTVGASVAYGTPQLRNLVFARGPSGGAPAGTCQIMMRAGSTTLNHAANTSVGISHTLNNAPTITQFAGGVGGAWGWFYNAAAIGVGSSIAAGTYGLFANKPMVSASAFAETDVVQVRTGRNATIAVSSQIGAKTTRQTYLSCVFDNGTVWAGDPVDGKLTIDWTTAASAINWSEANQYTVIKCRRRGGLTVICRVLSNYTYRIADPGTGGASFGMHLERVAIVEPAHAFPSVGPTVVSSRYTNRADFTFSDCLLDFSATPRPNLGNNFVTINTEPAKPEMFRFVGNLFKWSLTGVGSAAAAVAFATPSIAGGSYALELRGNRFETGASVDLKAFDPGIYGIGEGVQIVMENNSGIGLPSGPVGVGQGVRMPNSAMVLLDSLGIGGSAKFENRSGYCEFAPGQPVLSSLAPDGTPWSWSVFWTSGPQAITPGRPFELPPSRQQVRLATGLRTWSMELLLDATSLAQISDGGVVELQYIDNTSAVVVERVPVVLQVSGAAWVNVSSAPYNTWQARKVTGTTQSQVANASLLVARLVLERPAIGASAQFMLNPEVVLT